MTCSRSAVSFPELAGLNSALPGPASGPWCGRLSETRGVAGCFWPGTEQWWHLAIQDPRRCTRTCATSVLVCSHRLTSSVVDSHVRTSHQRDIARALLATARACGLSLTALSESSSPPGSSSKTSRVAPHAGSMPYVGAWKDADTKRYLSRCRRALSALRTGATESSSSVDWSTPLAGDAQRSGDRNRGRFRNLHGDVRDWPTAVTTDAKGARRNSARGDHWTSNQGETLTDAVRAEWPTITASRYGSQNNGTRDGVTEYATKGTKSLDGLAVAEGGTLNPSWVEALMGFPLGWTCPPSRQLDLFSGRPSEESLSVRGSLQGQCQRPPSSTAGHACMRSGMPPCLNAARSSGGLLGSW